MLADSLKRVSHGGRCLPWLTVITTAAAVLVFAMLGPAPELLVLGRSEVQAGEWWRLITGHLVHSDSTHAFWDIVALFLIGSLLERKNRMGVIQAVIVSLLFINSWVWWGMPGLEYYCGLSGINNTLFALLLFQLWHEKTDPLILAVGAGYLGKLTLELALQKAVLTTTAWPSVPSVHIVGMTAAVVLLAGRYLKNMAECS